MNAILYITIFVYRIHSLANIDAMDSGHCDALKHQEDAARFRVRIRFYVDARGNDHRTLGHFESVVEMLLVCCCICMLFDLYVSCDLSHTFFHTYHFDFRFVKKPSSMRLYIPKLTFTSIMQPATRITLDTKI